MRTLLLMSALMLAIAGCGQSTPAATDQPTSAATQRPDVIPAMCHVYDPAEVLRAYYASQAQARETGSPAVWEDGATPGQLSMESVRTMDMYQQTWERSMRDALLMGANQDAAVAIADNEASSLLASARHYQERYFAASAAARASVTPEDRAWLDDKVMEVRARAAVLSLCNSANNLRPDQ